jgi:hypothetical protein
MVMTGGWFMTLFEPPDLPEISPGLYIAGGGSPSDDAESWQASAFPLSSHVRNHRRSTVNFQALLL